MRRIVAVLAPVVAVAACSATAEGARVLTWKTDSRFVDPSAIQFGQPPRCGCVPHSPTYLPVNVYLPDGYDGRRRFPVLYLLHGAGGAYDYWLRVPTSTYDRGGNLRRIAARFPGIIVMPDGGAFGWYANWWNAGRRGHPGWERYHLDELTRLVERRLRIRRGRRFHAIAGFSMGGYGAAFYASQRPGYFGLAASLSGALSALDTSVADRSIRLALGDPLTQRFYWSGHDPVALARNLRWTRIYVRVGDGVPRTPEEQANGAGTARERELKAEARDFVAAARTTGARVRFEVKPGIHDHLNGRRSLADALRWARHAFRKRLPERPRRWTYKTVAKYSKAFGFRFRFRQPPTELISFRRRGRMLTARGSGAVRVRSPNGMRFQATVPFRTDLSRRR